MTLLPLLRSLLDAPPIGTIPDTIATAFGRAIDRDNARMCWTLAATPSHRAAAARRWRDLWAEWRTFVDAGDYAALLAAAFLLDNACAYTVAGHRGEQWLRSQNRYSLAPAYWLITRWQRVHWRALKPSLATALIAWEAGLGIRRAATAPPVVPVSPLVAPLSPWLN